LGGNFQRAFFIWAKEGKKGVNFKRPMWMEPKWLIGLKRFPRQTWRGPGLIEGVYCQGKLSSR